MSQQLLSSKVVTREEEPQVRQIQGVSTNDTAFAGVTERGPFGAQLVTSPDDYRRKYGGYTVNGEVAQTVDSFFANGGNRCWISRIVHCTDVSSLATKQSAQGSKMLQTGTGAPSAGISLGSLAEPFDLEPADNLILSVDG